MRSLTTVFLLSFVSACNVAPDSPPPDDPTASIASAIIEPGPGTCFLDSDRDGFGKLTAVHDDCDDPGYSYSNSDCNDVVATKWRIMRCYADEDHDGYGTGPALDVCAGNTCASAGYASNDDDCDDTRSSVLTTHTCFVDADGDHYGATATAQVACAIRCNDAPNRAENAGDCNDNDAAIHPHRYESPNGIDDDCDGAADLARANYGISGNTNTSTGFDVRLSLYNADERAAASAGELWGRVYYRKLEAHSEPWLTMPDAPAEMSSFVAVFHITGLEPLKAYEVRVDLYKKPAGGELERIRPLRDCNAKAPKDCANSDTYYTVTLPTSGTVKTARANIVLNALYEYGWFRTHSLGNWDDSLKDRYQLVANDTAYCTEFYANAAQPFLIGMNPCREDDTTATSHCDPADTGPSEDSVNDMKTWFDGSAEDFELDPDFTQRLPGDWLGVREDATSACGRHTQLFLAYDPGEESYWFVEGNGSYSNPFGRIEHTVNVDHDSRCQNQDDGVYCPPSARAYCDSGCFMIRTVGRVNDASKVD
ncbi:MAG: putative metal-binding motif-containing protein [Myxococcaceae bacterium]|nr:putative metal-binding motif-containing protein [Myxococcaceae bacterium]